MSRYRLFVGLDLPEETKDDLYDISDLQTGFRWISPDNYHLTLFFLGESTHSELESIHHALDGLQEEAFNLDISKLDYFGHKREPRILWAGIEKNDKLLALQKSIVRALRNLGFDFEYRKFVPHISLAKLKGASYEQLGHFLQSHSPFRLPPIEINHFQLFQSHLRPEGAQYQVLESYPLLDR